MNFYMDICFLLSEIAGSYGNYKCKLLRNLQAIFQSRCIILYSHQQCMKVSNSPHPHEYILLFVFLIIVFLVAVKYNLIVVKICIDDYLC